MNINSSNVVCFKLIPGFDVVGKLVKDAPHADLNLVSSSDTIYLEDALVLVPERMDSGELGFRFQPLSLVAEFTVQKSGATHVALRGSSIVAQIPLQPDFIKAYLSAVSTIQLI